MVFQEPRLLPWRTVEDNIRLALRHGVSIRTSNQLAEMRTFYALFAETSLRRDFFAEPYSFFLNLGSTLFACGMAELLFAEYEQKILATILVIYFGNRATYLYGGSSAVNRNVMPTYLLHWEAIQRARSRGCTEYDFYGIDPFDQPDHPYYGFSRYKRHFGGEVFSAIGAYDLPFYDRIANRLAILMNRTSRRCAAIILNLYLGQRLSRRFVIYRKASRRIFYRKV